MRRIAVLLAASVLALATTSGARAGTMSFQGMLGVGIVTVPPLFANGSGTGSVTVSGGQISTLGLPASAFATANVIVPITDSRAFPITGIQLTVNNLTGVFQRGTGPLGGIMPLAGTLKFCLLGNSYDCSDVTVPIPLSAVGYAGVVPVTASTPGGVQVSVYGAPWTTGTADFGTATFLSSSVPPTYGSTFLTNGDPTAPVGHVLFVTPIYIKTNLASFPFLPAYASLSVQFAPVPEPTTDLLLAVGIAGLALLGRSKSRR